MIISVNWLKKYLPDLDIDINSLSNRIGSRLVEIESVESLADKYRSVIIAKVVTCVDHEDSDHLHICKIDDGGVADVERDEDGLVQVVCGAPNVRQGLTVAWLPPGSIVPATYGNENFKLGSRKLRGVISYGMLASPTELALWDEDKGIMEAEDQAKPGQSLIDYLELDDTIIEVENKSLTHRPDCFGLIGFAREVAAIFDSQAIIPEWFNKLDGNFTLDNTNRDDLVTVNILNPELCSRYEAVVVSGINSQRQMPLYIKSLLSRSGVSPSLAAVDITNYLMLESGQPLHAFDYDKLVKLSPTGKADMIIRRGQKEEKLDLLDGRTISLTNEDIVVAVGSDNNSIPVALAGAMGGKETAINETTQNILLESATFDLYALRSTQFRHGIFSEAITRFTKGQPASLVRPVLLRAVDMITEFIGLKNISSIASGYPKKHEPIIFRISLDKFNSLLGSYKKTGYNEGLVIRTLKNLGYANVSCSENIVKATAPWWRNDLNIAEDVVEDVGRVNGYDDIEARLPIRTFSATPYNKLYLDQMVLRKRLSRAGGNEVLTYSFVNQDLLSKVGDDARKAYRIVNALSPNLQYYRRDILPNLLETARDNFRAGYDSFLLFEIGKVHRQGYLDTTDNNLPLEIQQLSGLLVNSKISKDIFYDIKNILSYSFKGISNRLIYQRLDTFLQAKELDSSINLFEPNRSAVVILDDQILGVVGEFKMVVRQAFKLPVGSAGFSIELASLIGKLRQDAIYKPLYRYQGTSRDITIQVSNQETFSEVENFMLEKLSNLAPGNMDYEVQPQGIYQSELNKRNITFHINFYDKDKTIDVKIVNSIIKKISDQLNKINGLVI